ncbi:hypothetical protein JCM1840_003768 [Sporobolomyces johnsonii]
MLNHATKMNRALPASRRLLTTTPPPPGRPAATESTNLNRKGAASGSAGYGGSAGPIPQAGGPKRGGGGISLPLFAALAFAAGGIGYYLTLDDPQKAASQDLHKLEDATKHEIDAFRTGARSSSEPLGPDASAARREVARYGDKLQSPDDRYGYDQLKNNVKSSEVAGEVRKWGDALSNSSDERVLAGRAQGVVDDVKNEVKRWGTALHSDEKAAWSGTGEGVKAEYRRWKDALSSPDGKMGVEQVEQFLRTKGYETTELQPRWMDVFGTAPALRKRQAETNLDRLEREGEGYLRSAANSLENEYERAKSAANNFGKELKSETNSWLSWGERKTEEGKDKAEAEYERAKQSAKNEASSWSSWTSAKTDDAKSAAASAYNQTTSGVRSVANSVDSTVKDAYNKTTSAASDAYNSTARGVEQAEDKAKAEAKSWWGWGSGKAEDAKEGVKDGLLSAEKGVEKGAQKAQNETAKL